jgi:cobalt-zinc-cadmium resistance protein CzcA
VIGGLITATLLTLFILPVFYIFFSSTSFRFRRKGSIAKKLAAVIFLFGISSVFNSIYSQQPRVITLHDAIQMALDSNLSVKSAGLSVDARKALKGSALDLPKTTIDGQYGQFNSFSNDNGVTISQSFEFPSVYVNKYKLANANIKSSELQYEVSRLEIATRVKQVFWQYLFLSSKKKLLVYQDSLYSGFLRAADLRAKAGETNRLEMITARSQSLEIKNQLFQVTSDITISSRKLMVLLNSRLPLVPSLTEVYRFDSVMNYDSVSVEQNPSLAYVKQQVEVSQITKKLERSMAMPDLNIGYFSQTITGTQEVNGLPQNFGKDYRFGGVQAGVSIPLWFSPYASRAKAAKINENIARTDAENYTRSISADLQSLLDEYNKYSSSVDYYEKQAVPEADLIIDQATRSYKAGALDYLDYVLTLNRALAIRQSYLDALNNYNQTIISIDFITGKVY